MAARGPLRSLFRNKSVRQYTPPPGRPIFQSSTSPIQYVSHNRAYKRSLIGWLWKKKTLIRKILSCFRCKFYFLRESHWAAQAGLKLLLILLPGPSARTAGVSYHVLLNSVFCAVSKELALRNYSILCFWFCFFSLNIHMSLLDFWLIFML